MPSLVTCTAGTMMWLGGSSRSWTMYSPRSVSTRSISDASSTSFRPISSATMDLPLVTIVAPASRQRRMTMSQASAPSRAQCTWPPRAMTLRSKISR
jgi:hypothetical protein